MSNVCRLVLESFFSFCFKCILCIHLTPKTHKIVYDRDRDREYFVVASKLSFSLWIGLMLGMNGMHSLTRTHTHTHEAQN